MTKPLPSGEQFEISHGEQRATVVEVGGGVREYGAGGRAVLDPYPAEAICDGAHGTPLIPWPNRLADGRYSFDGVLPKENLVLRIRLWNGGVLTSILANADGDADALELNLGAASSLGATYVLECPTHKGNSDRVGMKADSLQKRLDAGKPPSWLEPVSVNGPVRVYRVKPAAGSP